MSTAPLTDRTYAGKCPACGVDRQAGEEHRPTCALYPRRIPPRATPQSDKDRDAAGDAVGRDWRSMQPPACGPGEHVPVIIHRTGGPSASERNACGKCGRVIYNVRGVWVSE